MYGKATIPQLRPVQRYLKRSLDVAGSIFLLALMSPAMILAAILVRLSSRGNALYTQTRLGSGGREYKLYKFRTMIADAERKTGPVLALARDPRITPVGRLLRATHIDELPQLFNVLRGDMSLIGPRPERPHFVEIHRIRFPLYDLRMTVRPGITGLAQICGSYSTSPRQKLRFDLMYINRYSLALDIQIFFKTVLAILEPGHAEGLQDHSVSALADENNRQRSIFETAAQLPATAIRVHLNYDESSCPFPGSQP